MNRNLLFTIVITMLLSISIFFHFGCMGGVMIGHCYDAYDKNTGIKKEDTALIKAAGAQIKFVDGVDLKKPWGYRMARVAAGEHTIGVKFKIMLNNPYIGNESRWIEGTGEVKFPAESGKEYKVGAGYDKDLDKVVVRIWESKSENVVGSEMISVFR